MSTGFVPNDAVGPVVSFTWTEMLVVYDAVAFVVVTVILYVPGVAVALNQKYAVSLPLTTYPPAVVFDQIRLVLVLVKADAVAFVPFVVAVNVRFDGRVMLTIVMFAVAPASVLSTEMLYVVCIVSLVL